MQLTIASIIVRSLALLAITINYTRAATVRSSDTAGESPAIAVVDTSSSSPSTITPDIREDTKEKSILTSSSAPESISSSLTRRVRDVGRCYKGYCWSWCLNDPNLKFWCYTTRGNTFDGGYVKCEKAYECEGVVKCAGACGL